MAFDFPSSPTEGAIYTPAGGPSFVYKAPAWRQVTTVQAIQLATAESRNRIVNGAMQVSQEWGNTASAASTALGYYPADQWWFATNHAPGTITVQRVQVATPGGATDRVRMTVGTAKASLAAGDYIQIIQYMEGFRVADFMYGTASAKQAICRFGFKAPAGTYTFSLQSDGSTRGYIANFTIAAGQANTDTVQTFIIPGDAVGTWKKDNSVGIRVSLCPACGVGAYQGAAGWQNGNVFGGTGMSNILATAGAVLEFFDFGFYLDPANTGLAPPFQVPDYAAELAACQRYWQRYTSMINSMGYTAAGVNNHFAFPLVTSMRATAALSFTVTSPNVNCTGPTFFMFEEDTISFYTTTTAAGMSYAYGTFTLNARM